MTEEILKCKEAAGIYLYGNGSFGREIYSKLIEIGFGNLKGFLDTLHSGNPAERMPTYKIDHYIDSIDSSENIIIISSSFLDEIKFEISRRKLLSRIFTIEEFFCEYIKEKIGKDIDVFKKDTKYLEFFSGLTNYFITNVVGFAHKSIFWGDRLLTLDKSNGFLSDKKFRSAFEEIIGAIKYNQYDGRNTIAHRLNTLVWAARNCLELDGDFVECGVQNGDMSWFVMSVVDFNLSKKKFYLYDSYEGFSTRISSASDYPENPEFFEKAQKTYKTISYDAVVERFSKWPMVKPVRGFLPESLEIVMPERISYLHMDLNSPVAEVGVLEKLFDRVVSGGCIIFDDYGWKAFGKLKEAEDAFMAKRGYAIFELPTGQGMVIKR